jgi:glutamyl-Q tRNA(Asp) synthetase
LENSDRARAAGGRLLLRIEDIDAARCRPEFEAAIYEDLAWLGLAWEEPVRRQSEHLDGYRAVLDQLTRADLIYPSFESRGEILRLIAEREAQAPWPRDPDGTPLYPGSAKDLPADERARRMARDPYALRLDSNAAAVRAGPLVWHETGVCDGEVRATPEAWGDVILARKDTPTSYHLSVVVDDALQGITHVVRGQDLFASTSVHRLLQAVIGLPAPIYHHHRLVLDRDGHKLAKSTGATALRTLRGRGATPADIRRMVGLR